MKIIDNGKNNEISGVNDLNGIIVINGNNNKINLGQGLKNIDFLIDGDNNYIEIQENVTIFKILHINISDNECIFKIGKHTTIFELNVLINENNNKVEIGEDCMISRDVRILASDSHSIILKETNECINYHKTGVKIGNHVWLGINTLILKDTQIGDNSVVAAGAVVTNKENLEGVVLGGNPAKIIKTGITWERKTPQKTEIAKEEKLNIKQSIGNIMYKVEKTIKDEKTLGKISGWAYVENAKSNESDIFFELKYPTTSKIYKAQMHERQDISKVYGEQYINSGFDIVFPKNIKAKKIEEVNIIIKNQEETYKNKIW